MSSSKFQGIADPTLGAVREPPAGRILDRSQELSKQISQVIPGGVDSPFRSFHEVGGHTIFFKRGAGAYLFDVDGNKYIDYLGAWGPAILGHAPPNVVSACQQAIADGAVIGAPHEFELELARLVVDAVPSIGKVRFVNSGTEAVMSAVRLARGFTGRDLILMFEGAYHGHSDSVLASTKHTSSSGIPKAVASNTITVPFNNIQALKNTFTQNGKQIAAVLVEPVCGSMGVVTPEPGFLEALRALCTQHESLLIFDEVITGFRLALGGAQSFYNVLPDLTCLGKSLGGGMPIGAYGGKKEIMDRLMPDGDVYQAGTFSGNPATMAAGIATLKSLSNPKIYTILEERTNALFGGISQYIKNKPIQLQRAGSMFSILFSAKPVRNYQDSLAIDAPVFAKFFHLLLSDGIYMPPSAVDAACLSSAHSSVDIEATVSACERALLTCL